MKTLLIDNYDSFTYNLFQLLGEANGEEPRVVHNDAACWAELARLDFDNVVISPGPGRPGREGDFGVCAEAIRRTTVPLLGVCLGHQGLAYLHGAQIVAAPQPLHGRISAVFHDDSPLFAGIPGEFQAVRYHSLCVEQPLPDQLRGVAWASDGVLMALEHRDRPLYGVQFHPESACTEHGRRLLENFRDLSAAWGRQRGHACPDSQPAQNPVSSSEAEQPATPSSRPFRGIPVPSRRLVVKRLELPAHPELAFVGLYGESENAFWLDSSRVDEGARFSFMGDDGGPLGAKILYDVVTGELKVERGGGVELRQESIFEYLAAETRHLQVASPDLPFEFNCGFAGYFGYELKARCGGEAAHESPLPDAAFVLADRMIAFDHAEGHAYLLSLAEARAERAAQAWIEETEQRLRALPQTVDSDPSMDADAGDPAQFRLARQRDRYLREIVECKRLLAEGETYEVCLTNQVETEAEADPLALYRALRRVNPAPFSSYLRFGDVSVLSSSPERFLRVGRDRWVEAKPIKGTSRRGEVPAEDVRLAEQLRSDEKSRAENMMIADLMRNDLGSVCEIGTVHVPELMRVETYETLHQLVTTVRGLLREDVRPVDCIRACFPPGSMTGAPKRRTMQIIDRLEGESRGVYSGAIGYLGLGGAADLSVAIRTIVCGAGKTTTGAGGAIVVQSDPEDEYEEMLLKAVAPMRAIDPAVSPADFLGRRAAARAESSSAPRSPA